MGQLADGGRISSASAWSLFHSLLGSRQVFDPRGFHRAGYLSSPAWARLAPPNKAVEKELDSEARDALGDFFSSVHDLPMKVEPPSRDRRHRSSC